MPKTIYYYNGLPLKDYCELVGFNYATCAGIFKKKLDAGKFEGLTIQDALNKFMSEYMPINLIKINGKTIKEICIENNINYSSMVCYIRRNGYKDKTIEEVVMNGISYIRERTCFYYKGRPIAEVCLERKIIPRKMIDKIRIKMKEQPDRPIDEIVEECVDNHKCSTKYKIDGMSLYKRCCELGINPSTVINRLKIKYPNVTPNTLEECLKDVIQDILSGSPSRRAKYSLDGKSLYRICRVEHLVYSRVNVIIKELEVKYPNLSSEEIIKMAIQESKDRRNEKNPVKKSLEKNQVTNNEDKKIEDVCKELKVDYDTATSLIEYGFNYDQAINIIFYFSDSKTEEGLLSINSKKVRDIAVLIHNLKRDYPLDKVSLYELIALLKCNLLDTTNLILEKERTNINNIVMKTMKLNNITYTDELFASFVSVVKELIMEIIIKTSINKEQILIEYLDRNVKARFRSYVKKYIKDPKKLEYKPKEEN